MLRKRQLYGSYFQCMFATLNSVHPALSAGGARVEPPTKFSKRGAWKDFNFYRGVAGKEGGDFFQAGLQFSHKK